MTNIDRDLNNMKKEFDNLKVPDELETHLRKGLSNIANPRRYNTKLNIASLIVALILIGFGGNTLAHYSKRLIGYENVMNGTLRELNRLDRSQIVDKSYTFEDGSQITLDALMADANNLVVFYSFYNPNGMLNDNSYPTIYISGPGGPYNGGGHGQINEDGKEMKWVMTYDAPKFYEKNLKMTFRNDDGPIDGEINFQIDRKKVMGKDLKINIKKEIKILDSKIKVKSLIASPISTTVKGEFKNLLELGLDHLKNERIHLESVEMVLLANGKPLALKGSSMSTNLKGSYFDIRFDALPKDTKEIELKLISISANQMVNQRITLEKDSLAKTIDILEEEIIINKVYEENGNTYISITTADETYLSNLYLDIDGKEIGLEQTIEAASEKNSRTRTVEFKATGENLELLVKRLRFKKDFAKPIYTEKIK